MNCCLSGKKILVTGAGKGVGRCLTEILSRGQIEVFAISRTDSDLKSLKREYPSVHTFQQDVSQWKETQKLVRSLPVMDGLVNNAAIGQRGEMIGDISDELVDKIMAANVKSALNISQCVAKMMIEAKRPGSIVNVSSLGGVRPFNGSSIYAMSKSALDHLTRSMALEWGRYGIRTNSVNPTILPTPMGKKYFTDKEIEKLEKKIPLGRIVYAEEVAQVIIFLLSEKSQMINGITLPLDGGQSAAL